jgi:hypothetical protein
MIPAEPKSPPTASCASSSPFSARRFRAYRRPDRPARPSGGVFRGSANAAPGGPKARRYVDVAKRRRAGPTVLWKGRADLMETPNLPRYSVSPPYSFASGIPVPAYRVHSLADSVRAIFRWVSGRGPKPSQSERQLEAKIVAKLAEEIALESEASVSQADNVLFAGGGKEGNDHGRLKGAGGKICYLDRGA